jgi:cytochrome c-type biogenesis protein CcmH
MLFWVVAAVLTLAACLAVLVPLVRRPASKDSGKSHDLEVYRDQLGEVERDAARGLIGQNEAEQARAEIGRRILQLGDQGTGTAKELARPATRVAAMAAVLAVPLVAWGLYAIIGSPDLPSQPLRERLAKNPTDSTVDELVARAEAHLAANPKDGRGWDVLAPIYLRIGRPSDAVTAYRNAIKINGDTAGRESGLGEAIAMAAGGMISAEAEAAFERALELEAGYPKARFYLAGALVQEGKLNEALGAWRALLAALPEDSPWRLPTEQAIAEAERRFAAADAESAPNGPSQDEIDAAAEMSPEDRTAMIETMVAQLDEKLRANPRDAEGWRRLLRSYQVLGNAKAARDALQRGVAAFGAGSDEAKELEAFAVSLGLAKTE